MSAKTTSDPQPLDPRLAQALSNAIPTFLHLKRDVATIEQITAAFKGWDERVDPSIIAAQLNRLTSEPMIEVVGRKTPFAGSKPETASAKPSSRKIEAILAELPEEVSTEEAAQILGQSKDTVLKFREAGLLEFRNAAAPGSTRPVYRFKLESVLRLRTSYETDGPTPPMPSEPHRRRGNPRIRTYKHVKLDD